MNDNRTNGLEEKDNTLKVVKFSVFECKDQKKKTVKPVKDEEEKPKKAEKKNENLEIAKPIKNISVFLDDIDTKVIKFMEDKGVTMSTYSIASGCNLKIEDVYNVLDKKAIEGTVVKRQLGKDNFWFISNPK